MTRKTHCKRRHEFTTESTYTTPSTGKRSCIICTRERKRYAKNPEKYREAQRKWRAKNPKKYREQGRASMRKRRTENPEKCREQIQAWRDQNPAKVKEHARRGTGRRRARKLDQLGFWPISESTFISLLWETDPNCYYCRTPIKGAYHLDHKIPLSRPEMCPAGKKLHEPWNLRLSCPSCNFRKHNKTAEEFRALLIGSRSNQ